MRIIADKRDYYDCVQAHGQDQTLLYVRNPEKIDFKSGECPFPTLWGLRPYGLRFGNGFLHVITRVVGFCGKIYPMLEVSKWNEREDRDKAKKCFNIDEVDAFVKKHLTVSQSKDYYGNKRRWYSYGTRKNFAKFFDECKRQQDSHTQIFLEKRCPIFVATFLNRSGSVVYNSMLRPYDFVRIFDPYTAFQEVSMYMGAMAMPEKVMPVIPDEMKVHSHGFDKWSFRRPPGG